MSHLHQIGQDIWEIDVSCTAGFDEDGTLNLEWIGSNCRVGASFPPDRPGSPEPAFRLLDDPDDDGSAWWFVKKDEPILDGPHSVFDDEFLYALKCVEKDQRENFRKGPTNWWRQAFIGLAFFNATFWLLRWLLASFTG